MSCWIDGESLSTGRAPPMIRFNRVRDGDVEMPFAGRPESAGKILALIRPDSGEGCPSSVAA
jgi:hypothetical protein